MSSPHPSPLNPNPQTPQGYLAHKKQPPQDHNRALGMFLPQGPRGALFRLSEVPLQALALKRPQNRQLNISTSNSKL